MHSLEIIEFKFEKEHQTLLCILELFANIVCEFEKCVVIPNFLLGFHNTWEDLPFLQNHKSGQEYL